MRYNPSMMLVHGYDFLLIVLVYFIIVVIVMAMLWRIATALDSIAKSSSEIVQELKKLASSSGGKKE